MQQNVRKAVQDLSADTIKLLMLFMADAFEK